MTEYSLLWATGTSGDGTDAYTSDETRKLWLAMFSNGVFKGYLNGLAVTGTASPIAINTGAAIIQGHPYFNTASVSKTIGTPSTGTTGLRVVVRVDWLGRAASTVTPPLYPATNQYEARIIIITNEDGTAAIPDPIITDADTYDLTLATGTITTAGVVALTDARTYAKARREDIVAADIANRTRSFLVQAPTAVEGTGVDQATFQVLRYGNTSSPYGPGYNVCTADDSSFVATGLFTIPHDYASGLTITALVYNSSSQANIVASLTAIYYAVGEDWGEHTASFAESTITLPAATLSSVSSTSLTSAGVGDFVEAIWTVDSSAAGYTVSLVNGRSPIAFAGFLVTYTADS